MRFIYLSVTKEDEFSTKQRSIEFFKDYLRGDNDRFQFTKGKMDKSKFDVGEDIFFLRAEKVLRYYTYKVIAYCKSESGIDESDYCFKVDPNSLKIFIDGIDINYFQKFIDDNDEIESKNFTGNIDGNKFTGPASWIYYSKRESEIIME